MIENDKFVVVVQMFLENQGFNPGPTDGIVGIRTWNAWNNYAAKNRPAASPKDVHVNKYTQDFNAFFEFLIEWEGAKAQAKHIYWQEWNAQGVADIPQPLRQVYFNYCVNTGQSRAVKFIQQALGITADGVLGPQTKQGIVDHNSYQFAHAVIDKADAFYRARPKFLKDWLNRNNALRNLVIST